MLGASHLRHGSGRLTPAVVVLPLAIAAWVAMLAWEASPYGRYLHHDIPAGVPAAVAMPLFVAGWTVMIVAMMVPTTLPLLATFEALTRSRRRPGVLVALVVAGYLLAWVGFGLVAWLADRGIHAAVDATPALAARPWIVLAATFVVAGLFQFSALKYRCLDACRSPLGFVLGRWQGRHERREALVLGVAHGLVCVGCCWALMLVMFGIGLGSVAWMLAIGTVTAIEKNVSWGRRLGRPLGVVLLVAGLAVLNG